MAFANTDLSIVGILTYRKENSLEANAQPLPNAIGISDNVIQRYLIPCEVIDTLILPQINLINQKKQEIVNICQQASALGVAITCTMSGNESAVNTTYAQVLTGSASTAIGVEVGFGSTEVIGIGAISEDTLQAYVYPNIENGVYTTDNPLDGEGYVKITSSNVGIGKETKLFPNSGGSNIGIVVNLTGGGGGNCAQYASEIQNLIQEIVDIRAGIANTINSATTIKGYKTTEQLNYWTLNRIQKIHLDDAAAIDLAVSILNDPAYGGPY
jgi:hypothetical protein